MKKNFKIFDVILFGGDLDLLNLRFSEFYDIIDFFVVVPFSDEIKCNIDIKFKHKVIIFDTFKNETHLYDLLKEFLKTNYESFDDIIFTSCENEIPNFSNLDEIIEEIKFRLVLIEHKTLCWNVDYYIKQNESGSHVFTFSSLLTNKNILIKKNLNSPSDFELPKNVGILAYNKIGRDYMKKHLFLVESSNTVNLNEVSKLYDTVSIIEFSDKLNEVIAESIGESVYKSILHLPTNVLYGEKPLKDFHDDYKINEIKKIIETVFPQDQDSIRIIYKGFDDVVGLWENFKNQKFSEIINPS